MVNIIFVGAPGSGKGTQSSLLSENLKIPNISTGDILRKEVEAESEIGVEAKRFMEAGELVPDEVIVGIIKKRIAQVDCKNGFILDGFPRNLKQSEALEVMLLSENKKIDLVVNIEVEDEILIKRISGRFSCKKCASVYNRFFSRTKVEGVCDKCSGDEFISRSDDNEETVKNRLKVYNQNTEGLINFYRKKGLIYSVNGLKNIALVNLEINEAVSKAVSDTSI